MGKKIRSGPAYLNAKIIESKQIGPPYHRISISLPWPIGPVKPGQFAMLGIEGNYEILLPRPLSIHNFDSENDASRLEFLFKVVGKGTEALAKLPLESQIQVLAPLGKGFPDLPSGYKALLVAGGMGIAPLFPLILRLIKKSSTILQLFYGAKSKNDLICLPELLKLKVLNVTTVTEDGSHGEKGVVTKPLVHATDIDRENAVIYSCGPEPMLKAIAAFATKQQMLCWVSVERRMACGVGACLGCVINTVDGYRCSCTDGPIFNSRDILWSKNGES